MAKRIKAELVLKLLAKGMNGREMCSTRHISQRSIKLIREMAEYVDVIYNDVAVATDCDVHDLLFPAQREASETYAVPYRD